MTEHELKGLMSELSHSPTLPDFNAGAMAISMAEELAVVWEALPEQKRAFFLAIAAMMYRHGRDAHQADQVAAATVRKMKGPR